MNKQQALDKLKNARLDEADRETLFQYLHYLSAEGIAKPPSAKRPKKKFTHKTNPRTR
jgi:hypothetical protein|tara:strand:- start:433 stop:606 length:174 start_codon:yes stop_codon:yes gene_type:complete